MTSEVPSRRRRRTISPITRRILAVNVLALGILVAGLLYLGQYRQSLIDAELTALMTQADMFAAALGEGAVSAGSQTGQRIVRDIARQIVRRLAQTTGTRARLFGADGVLLADSRLLMGPGGMVQIRELPPPDFYSEVVSAALEVYDRLVLWLPVQDPMPLYREESVQRAEDYDEVPRALAGKKEDAVRTGRNGGIILSVAVPVQRYKKVLGALMLSKGSREIEAAVFEVEGLILSSQFTPAHRWVVRYSRDGAAGEFLSIKPEGLPLTVVVTGYGSGARLVLLGRAGTKEDAQELRGGGKSRSVVCRRPLIPTS